MTSQVEKVSLDQSESSRQPSTELRSFEVTDEEITRRRDLEEVKRLSTRTDKGTELSFTIWDYGGQEVFYAFHHIFLTDRGIYLVVFNMFELLKEGECACSEPRRFLRFWLNSIQKRAPASEVLQVGTHMDKIKPDQLGTINKGWRRKSRNVYSRNGHLCFFPVNNKSKSDSGAQELRAAILKVSKSDLLKDVVERLIPFAWHKVAEALQEKKLPRLTKKELADCGKKYGVVDDDLGKML